VNCSLIARNDFGMVFCTASAGRPLILRLY
jgi:hypothetical protein